MVMGDPGLLQKIPDITALLPQCQSQMQVLAREVQMDRKHPCRPLALESF